MIKRNIADTLLEQARFSVFLEAVRRAGMDTELRSGGPFTVFAPIDKAFDALNPETRAQLATDAARLRAVVEYHVLRGSLESANLRQGAAKTLGGSTLRIGATDDGPTVDHANLIAGAIHCYNGVVHPIDAVIVPGYVPPVKEGANLESPWSGRRRIAAKAR